MASDAERPGVSSAETIFNAALSLSGDERSDYLAGACGDNLQLRERVEALLRAHEAPEGFLPEKPSVSQAADVIPTTLLAGLPSEQPGDTIGRYKLLQKLGEGGCGVVYMADQEAPVRRKVALKIIKLGMDTKQVVARFEAERQALALMEHPNIAKVLDAGATETGRPYFVMELVGGIKITDYCEQNKLATRRRLDLFIQICHAIQHAHQKGVIHRDIKPSNVLVAMQDGTPVPKVIDFGIAKATQGRLTDQTVFTAFEQFIGTPAYMSPEQAQLGGLDVDTRSDIYSLGVMLYELLTGKTPFDSKELLASGLDVMRRTIQEKEPPTPSTRLKQELAARSNSSDQSAFNTAHSALDKDLDWIVMKCLEKDRGRRYETANGVAMDVQRYLDHVPVVASPPGNAYRIQKFIRRYRAAVLVTFALTTVLITGVVVSSYLAVRAQRAEREQTRLHQDALQAQGSEARERSKAEERLYDSLLGQVRALRIGHRVGYRDTAFQLLQQAKALDLPQKKDSGDLTQEAVACLGDFIGLTPVSFADFPPETAINRACLDPSGRLAAFGLSDGTTLLRELPSGKEVARFRTELPPMDLCFNPQGDQLVSIHYLPRPVPTETRVQPSRIYVWGRSADNRWTMIDEIPCPGAWEALQCGDGMCVTSFSYHPRQGRILDLKTKSIVQVFSFPAWGTEWGIPCATVSADGRFLAAENQSEPGLHDHEIDILDLKTGKLVKRVEPHMGDLSSLKFSPDATELCCLSDYEGAVIYRMSDFKPIAEFSGAFKYRSRPSFTRGGSIAAMPTGQRQNGVRLWDLIAREEIATLDEPEPATEALLSNDERTLMTYGIASARLYQADGAAEKRRLPGHAGVVPGMAFGPSGTWLASVGTDRKVRVWDCTTGRQNWASEDLPGSGQSIACSPDGKLLAAGDSDTRMISFWDPTTGTSVRGLGTNSIGWNWSTQFSPDGRFFFSAAGGYEYKEGLDVWALDAGAQAFSKTCVQAKLLTHLPINCWSLIVAPDSHTVAFVDNPGEVNLVRLGGYHLYVWDLNSTNAPRVFATNLIATAQSASFSPDSQRLFYADAQRDVVVADVSAGREISRFATLEPGRTRTWTDFPNLCLSPDGKMLAMVSPSSLGVDLWAADSGRFIFSLPEQNGAPVCSLAWAPDSQRFAVARANGNVAIWNLPEINRILAKLELANPR